MVPTGTVTLSASQEGDHIMLSIKDDGAEGENVASSPEKSVTSNMPGTLFCAFTFR
jgi:chemotaxis protein histidine kinase CheA